MTEGRYHQVRRMFAAVGNHVVALHRDRIGGLDAARRSGGGGVCGDGRGGGGSSGAGASNDQLGIFLELRKRYSPDRMGPPSAVGEPNVRRSPVAFLCAFDHAVNSAQIAGRASGCCSALARRTEMKFCRLIASCSE